MLIRDTTWREIREQFSEDEKVALRQAVTGESICPRGFSIDPAEVEDALLRKLKTNIRIAER